MNWKPKRYVKVDLVFLALYAPIALLVASAIEPLVDPLPWVMETLIRLGIAFLVGVAIGCVVWLVHKWPWVKKYDRI